MPKPKEADQLIKQARSQVEKERSVFRSSLQQSSKQVLEFLRQEIEQKFFNEELQNLLEKQSANPKLIADLVSGIVDGIEKEGIKGNIEVVIPQKVSAQEVNALLLTHVAQKLKDHPIEVGNFSGGVQVKLVGKKMTLDLTDQALKELLANFARKDFRQTIFSN